MQGGTCQEASTSPALPPPPRTWMQQHFLIIFFTADLWWGLRGKERKLLECWEWECQKHSPYTHWGQRQESGPKLAKNVCLICINFCSQEAGEWSKDVSSAGRHGSGGNPIPGKSHPGQGWLQITSAQVCIPCPTLDPFTGHCRGKTSSQRIFPRVRMCTPTPFLLSLPEPQHYQAPSRSEMPKTELMQIWN